MALSFYDPRSNGLREFRPAAAPVVGVERAAGGPREAAVAAALEHALAFLGLQTRPGVELRVGGVGPGAAEAWLNVAPLTGGESLDCAALERRGFAAGDFHYLCLRTHYRRPLAFSWEALASARGEREGLAASARSLSMLSLEPSPRALSGYLQRFRDALSRDLDLPGALDCLWDALRPGALSPGSKAALLRAALPALGLHGSANRP